MYFVWHLRVLLIYESYLLGLVLLWSEDSETLNAPQMPISIFSLLGNLLGALYFSFWRYNSTATATTTTTDNSDETIDGGHVVDMFRFFFTFHMIFHTIDFFHNLTATATVPPRQQPTTQTMTERQTMNGCWSDGRCPKYVVETCRVLGW